jgi:ABC-type dipeptide/oligopeptide/nickel transport system permease subunit
MFLLIPRFLFIVVMVATLCILVKLVLLCHNNKKPLAGVRKFLVNLLFNIFMRLVAIFGFFTWHRHVRLTRDEVDYSPYLGTNEEIPIGDSLGNLMKEFYS